MKPSEILHPKLFLTNYPDRSIVGRMGEGVGGGGGGGGGEVGGNTMRISTC